MNVKMRTKNSPRKSKSKYGRHKDILPINMRNLFHCAKNRNLELNVEVEELWELYIRQNKKCALSGIGIEFAKTWRDNIKGGTTASLDRIDSTKGYVLDNVQWVHKDVNRMKSDISQEQFIELCKLVVKHKGANN